MTGEIRWAVVELTARTPDDVIRDYEGRLRGLKLPVVAGPFDKKREADDTKRMLEKKQEKAYDVVVYPSDSEGDDKIVYPRDAQR